MPLVAQKIAEIMSNRGYRVVILNRGYRSHWDKNIGVVSDGKQISMTAYEAGDEAYLMAKTLPNIPVIIGKNRAVTGKYAVEHFQAKTPRKLTVVPLMLQDTLPKISLQPVLPINVKYSLPMQSVLRNPLP